MPDPFAARAAAMAAQLREAHATLRADLATVRSGLRPDLLTHCLAFCEALSAHHGKESAAFPLLDERFPELAAVLERLRDEHTVLARTLTELEKVLPSLDTGEAHTRFDRLAADVEAHFAY